MATVSRGTTFSDGTTAYGSQVETDFSTIYTAWNNHDAGTSTWTVVKSSSFLAANGTTSVPTMAYTSEPTTGWFRGGTGRMDLSVLGTNVVTFSSTAFGFTLPLSLPDGTAGAPSLNLTNALTTGLFKPTTNALGIVSNGVERMRFDANGNILSTTGTLLTTATNGYFAISTCAGAATGVPAAAGSGNAFLQYDSTNFKLYIYHASWKSIQLV